jgi:hypothetical protein
MHRNSRKPLPRPKGCAQVTGRARITQRYTPCNFLPFTNRDSNVLSLCLLIVQRMSRSKTTDDEAASLAFALKLQAEFDEQAISGKKPEYNYPIDDRHRQPTKGRPQSPFQRQNKFSLAPKRGDGFRGGKYAGQVGRVSAPEAKPPMSDEELAILMHMQENSDSGAETTPQISALRPSSSRSDMRRTLVPPPPVPPRFLPGSPPITPGRPQNPPAVDDDDLPPPYTPRGSDPYNLQPPPTLSPPYTPHGRNGVEDVDEHFRRLSLGNTPDEPTSSLLEDELPSTVSFVLFQTNC